MESLAHAVGAAGGPKGSCWVVREQEQGTRMRLPGSGWSAPVTGAESQRKPAVRVRSLITLRGAPGDVRAERGGSTHRFVGGEGRDCKDPRPRRR